MFHLLGGVPCSVKDALQAASTSTVENSSRSLSSVQVEIESAFHNVPPLVKDALDAANTSACAVMEENLASLYLCFSDEFDKMKKQYEERIAELERENNMLKSHRKVMENQPIFLMAKQQLNDTQLSGRRSTQANTILQTQPNHDRNSMASPELSSNTNIHDTTQQLDHHQAKEVILTQFDHDQNTLASPKLLSNWKIHDTTHFQTVLSPQAHPSPMNNQHHVSGFSRSLDLKMMAIDTEHGDAGVVDTTHNTNESTQRQLNQAEPESESKKSETDSSLWCNIESVEGDQFNAVLHQSNHQEPQRTTHIILEKTFPHQSRREKNRICARNSRLRRKMEHNQLEHSVVVYACSNEMLKKENEELERILFQAQMSVASAIEGFQH